MKRRRRRSRIADAIADVAYYAGHFVYEVAIGIGIIIAIAIVLRIVL